MKSRNFLALPFSLLSLLLVLSLARATTFANRPLGDVVKESPVIARGKAGESYSQWDKSGRGQIFTYTPFTVIEVLKGELKEARIVLRQPGGSAGDVEMSVPGTATFSPDQDAVVLLGGHNAEDDSYDIPGFATGKYDVVKDAKGDLSLVNSLGGGAVYEPDKDPRTLSYNSKIPFEVFKKLVKGDEVSAASRSQYERSDSVPPAGVYDADHADHVPRSPVATPSPREQDPKSIKPDEREPAHSRGSSLWIPLSFAALGILGGLMLWRLAHKES